MDSMGLSRWLALSSEEQNRHALRVREERAKRLADLTVEEAWVRTFSLMELYRDQPAPRRKSPRGLFRHRPA